MSIIPRVAASAQLNITGSVPQRLVIAAQKRDAFLRDAFLLLKKDAEISRSEIDCLLGHYALGVDFSVGRTLDLKEYSGCVDFKYSKKGLTGLSLELPFDKNSVLKESPSAKTTLVHEITHFFEMLANPKIAARDAALEARKVDPGFVARQKQYDKFYESKLYNDDFKFHHHKEKNTETRMHLLGEQMGEMFGTLKAPSDEKIDILQDYRNSLKLEYNARKAESYAAETPEEKLRHEKYLHDFFYQGKIQVIEGLLRGEIASHRKVHAESLRKNN